jgi:hypothetical protein
MPNDQPDITQVEVPMLKKYFPWIVSLLLLVPVTTMAQAPHEIAGLKLGNAVTAHTDVLRMQTALPIRHVESIQEVEVVPAPGFKSGLVWYGTCNQPHQILRISLKYADSSKKFYQQLLKRYEDRFGKPQEWRGDPFHLVRAWKWSFTDAQNNRISLILQHNRADQDERLGNSVKLTMWNLFEAERACHRQKVEPSSSSSQSNTAAAAGGRLNWDQLIPR